MDVVSVGNPVHETIVTTLGDVGWWVMVTDRHIHVKN